MSAATERIAYYWVGKGDASFLTAGRDITEEDKPLLDAGVFKLANDEQDAILCPFGCGDIEEIHKLPRYDGKGSGHFVFCSRGCGEKELEPRDYQLYRFDPLAMLRFNGGVDKESYKPKRVRRPRQRKTEWIMIERKAVLEYADDPKRNTEHKQPHELCHHVWQLNRDEFEAAARLRTKERGYKNADALRAHFYRQKR